MNINDREMLHIMEHVINNPYMGVIYINTDCEILLVNETFAEILGVDRDSIIGQPIQKIVPKSRLPHTVKTGEANLCELCMVNNKEMISMRVPIYSNGKIIGAMAKTLFLDISTARLLTGMISLNEDTARSSSKYQSKYTLDDIIGNNRRIVRLKTWSAQVANNSSNVLIIGESGTGKELFAHAIHHAGIRRNYPFIRINCASIPENLIESELFGYEEGAFTGALKGGKKGKFELAHKGTIFLDEIGEMPLSMQTKLLAFLQEREFERVGGSDPIHSDARIIAATNIDLEKAVAEGRFREDLYYRLNVVTFMLPPLRDRIDDIEPLVNHLIPKLNNKLNTSIEGIEPDALDLLMNYHWPGNVRELENLLERAINLAHLDQARLLLPEHFPTLLRKNTQRNTKPATLSAAVESLEYQLIMNTLRSNNYNKTVTAKQLNIHPSVLYRKLKKYNIS
ncbi:MAG TPA: sigma 54-interacting transcriptional regulator [Syntrophomonadaceae bacterium]|nr:sigma 54-interacting transcriptional regulator [Syntrophomonadaceae bacterium]